MPRLRCVLFSLQAILLVAGCDGSIVAPRRADDVIAQAAVTTLPEVSAGGGFTCARLANGTLSCWGFNRFGQATPPAGSFRSVDAGSNDACAIRLDGTLACWGMLYWSTGIPTGAFVEVSVAQDHACARRANGTLACWGNDGTQGKARAPAGAFTQVSSGPNTNCAIRTDGTLACWGSDGWGLRHPPAGTFVQVSVANIHSCAVRTDGSIACWGDNGNGESSPPAGRFVQVSAGFAYSCAIREDRSVACWGAYDHGQATPPEGRFEQVSAGQGHACAVRASGTLACWGNNSDGQASPPLLPEQPAAPTAPTGLHPSAVSAATVDLAWQDRSIDEAHFRLDRRTFDATSRQWLPWRLLVRVPANTAQYADHAVDAEQDYRYRVLACNRAGCSAADVSERVVATSRPAAPRRLTATATPAWSVALSWLDRSVNEAGFELQRRSWDETTSHWNAWTGLAPVGVNGTATTDGDVEPAIIYQYRLRACNADGCSVYTLSGNAVTATIPAAPTNLTAAVLADRVELTWLDASDDETHFQLQRTDAPGTNTWVAVATPAEGATSFVDALSPASRFRYRIRACNLAGCSTPWAQTVILVH